MVIRVTVVVACFISEHWMVVRLPGPHWVVIVVVAVTTALVAIFLISTSLVVEQTLEGQTI